MKASKSCAAKGCVWVNHISTCIDKGSTIPCSKAKKEWQCSKFKTQCAWVGGKCGDKAECSSLSGTPSQCKKQPHCSFISPVKACIDKGSPLPCEMASKQWQCAAFKSDNCVWAGGKCRFDCSAFHSKPFHCENNPACIFFSPVNACTHKDSSIPCESGEKKWQCEALPNCSWVGGKCGIDCSSLEKKVCMKTADCKYISPVKACIHKDASSCEMGTKKWQCEAFKSDCAWVGGKCGIDCSTMNGKPFWCKQHPHCNFVSPVKACIHKDSSPCSVAAKKWQCGRLDGCAWKNRKCGIKAKCSDFPKSNCMKDAACTYISPLKACIEKDSPIPCEMGTKNWQCIKANCVWASGKCTSPSP